MFKKNKILIKISSYFLFFALYLFGFIYVSGPAYFVCAQSVEDEDDTTRIISEHDSAGVNSVEVDSIADTLMPVIESDTSGIGEESLPKKSFIGGSKDVVIAAVSIVTWLAFMWLAANSP